MSLVCCVSEATCCWRKITNRSGCLLISRLPAVVETTYSAVTIRISVNGFILQSLSLKMSHLSQARSCMCEAGHAHDLKAVEYDTYTVCV